MGETAQQPAAIKTRQPIPGVASLRVNPERIEQMWQMTAQQRVEAAQQGQFTLGEMLRWASRRPSEPPVRRRVVLHHRPAPTPQPGERDERSAVRLRPPRQPPRYAPQRRHPLPGRRSPRGPAVRVRRRPRHRLQLLRLPAVRRSATGAGAALMLLAFR